MKKTQLILILLIVLLVSTFIRTYPIIDYSPEPVTYSGGGKYYLDEIIIKDGYLRQGNEIVDYGLYGGVIEEYQRYPLIPLFFAIIRIIFDVNYDWTFRLIYSLAFALPLLTFTGCIYCRSSEIFHVKRKEFKEYLSHYISLVPLFLVLLYSQLASPYVITQLGITGWIFIIPSFYLLTFKQIHNNEMIIVSLIFLTLLPAVYFTGASFLALWFIIFFMMYIIHRLFKENYHFENSNIMVFFIIFYLTYTVFLALNRFQVIPSVLLNSYDIFFQGSNNFQTVAPILPDSYILPTSTYNKIRYLSNAVLVGVPLIWFLLNKNVIKNKDLKIWLFILSAIMAIFSYAFFTYIWLGTMGIMRVAEYGSLISIIVVAILLSNKSLKKYKILTFIVCLALITSTTTYLLDENIPYRFITNNEENTINWIDGNFEKTDIIFTDHRLSGSLVGKGFLLTTGITPEILGTNSKSLLDKIYYSNISIEIEDTFDIFPEEPDILFFSIEMTHSAPAIGLYNFFVKPAVYNFMKKFDENSGINKVFSDGTGYLYTII